MKKTTTEQILDRGKSVAIALLPTLFSIFEKWGLSGKQQMVLLGQTNEKTIYNWKNNPEKAKLSKDLLERASYILSIYKSLQILLPDESQADAWLSNPNDNSNFNSATPLERMLAGHVVDLAEVRNFLDAERGGW